jgi:hypothetical protein
VRRARKEAETEGLKAKEERERERGIERKITDPLFATAPVVGITCIEAPLVGRG